MMLYFDQRALARARQRNVWLVTRALPFALIFFSLPLVAHALDFISPVLGMAFPFVVMVSFFAVVWRWEKEGGYWRSIWMGIVLTAVTMVGALIAYVVMFVLVVNEPLQ